MSRPISPHEHPFTPVILHWLHIASMMGLIVTGMQIATLPETAESAVLAHTLHLRVMPVFLVSAALRVAWAFLSAGSSQRGSHELMPDWKHFRFHRGDGAHLLDWVRHYLGSRVEVPDTNKYNPLQRAVYVFAFPACIVMLAVTGFALTESSARNFEWLLAMLGPTGVRLAHDVAMGALLLLTTLHVYAAMRDGMGRMSLMLLRWVPRSLMAIEDE